MMLAIHAQAAEPGVIQLWIGMFGTQDPPQPQIRMNGVLQQLLPPLIPTTPIRDGRSSPGGRPLNHRAIVRFKAPSNQGPCRVVVSAGTEVREFITRALPLVLGERLDILLCSCYYQPEDAGGLLGTVVGQLKQPVDLTIMAGDQIYGDLPLFEDLPESRDGMARVLGDKYLRNWASDALGIAGLQTVLSRAPMACVPDDHEFWNNYPFPQKQLPNTWRESVRSQWDAAARDLHEDYQTNPAAALRQARRIDIDPLKILLLDMRSQRDSDFGNLMSDAARDALIRWTQDLVAQRAAGGAAIGVLASGQALFVEPPVDSTRQRDVDAEMGNYGQFSLIQEQLSLLADHGIPVVYATGDVHWGRLTTARDQQTSWLQMVEVIASPSRLIRTPLLDTAKETANKLRGIFGRKERWPRHSDPDPPPARFGPAARFQLQQQFRLKGDQVALMSFVRAGQGVNLQVSYFEIHPDRSVFRPDPILALRNR